MSMRLLGSPTSPYVRKVRIVLAEKGLDADIVNEDVWSADTQIGRHNPLGKVPCLLLDGGRSLYDSRVIVAYLDTLGEGARLIPDAQRIEVARWEALADGLLDAAILARLEQTWPGRQDGQRSQAWIDRQRQKIDAALAVMADGLGANTWCMAGETLTLADVATGCALAYLDLRFKALDWRSRHAALARLLDEQLAPRASFVATRPA